MKKEKLILPTKEKKKGPESLLQELDNRSDELRQKRQKGWINEAEYKIQKEKLEEERLEVLTRPENK